MSNYVPVTTFYGETAGEWVVVAILSPSLLVYYLYLPSLPGTFYFRFFSGAQPITNLSGDVALSVNGEIYNHIELRLGCVFRVKTKLIYLKFGNFMLAKLNAKVLLVGIVRRN
jgi:hypothetical protein